MGTAEAFEWYANCEGMAYRHVELDGDVETERRIAVHESYGDWLAWLA